MLDLFSTVRDILRINADSWMHRLECYIYKCHVTFSNLSSSLGLFLFSRIPLSRPQAHEWQWLHSTPCRTVRYLEDKTLGYYHLYPIYICRTYVCRQFTYLELFFNACPWQESASKIWREPKTLFGGASTASTSPGKFAVASLFDNVALSLPLSPCQNKLQRRRSQ